MVIERKEDDPQNKDEKFSEVVKAVKAEVGKLGEGIVAMKANHTEMMTQYEALKALVDKHVKEGTPVPADIKAQIDKIAADVATRQEKLEELVGTKVAEEVASRMDAIDTFVQGVVKAGGGNGYGASEKTCVVGYETKTGEYGRKVVVPVLGTSEDEAIAFFKTTPQARKMTARQLLTKEKELREGGQFAKEYAEYLDAYKIWLNTFNLSNQPEVFKAMSIGSDPDGGYLGMPALSARVIQRIFERDPIRQIAAVETVTTSELKWMVDIDEAGAGWEGETILGAETTTPRWREKMIPVHTMYARPRLTQSLIEDANINVETWLGNKVGDRFARFEGAAFVSGSGVGQPRGFLTYPNGTDWGQIEQVVVGTVAGAIDCDGLIDVKYHLKEDYLARCMWLMRRTTVAEVMQLKDGMGQYIWKPGLIGEDPLASSLLGLPVRMSPTMPAIAASALSFVLAAWDDFYMIVDRLGITVQRDPYTAKPYVELYTRKRVGGDVAHFEAAKIGRVNP